MGVRSLQVRHAVAAAIAMALPLPAAWAQDTALDPVMVTAQRRIENVQDVPISVSTLDNEKLNILGSGGDDIRFLSGRVPSLLIESSFGRAFPRFYIRGLGNTDFDLNASQPVSLVYDDVVQENPILKGFPVFDLEMVEVFRGPQGTLFGRNTPAGVVKFNSVRPSRELGGYFQASYAEDNSVNIEGAVGGALGKNWAMRLSGMYQHRDDWVDNEMPDGSGTIEKDAFEGYEEVAGRVQFLYEPNEDFSALINFHARSLDGTARMFRANVFENGSQGLVSGFDEDVVSLDGKNDQDLDGSGGSLRIRKNFGRVTLHTITGYETVDVYSRGDIDGGFNCALPSAGCSGVNGPGFIPFSAESADGLSDHSQLSQEIRLESNEWGAFDWQAGVYHFDEEVTIDSFNYDSLAGGVQNGYAWQKQDNESWAIFGSVEYEFSDAFTLGAGLRYTDDEKDFTAQRLDSPPFQEFVGGALPIGPIGVSPQDEDITWDVSGTWSINDDTNVFARVARGYRAPSIQGRTLFSNSNDPDELITVGDSETIMSYEAGVKTSLFDGRGRLSLTVYKYIMDDQQLTAVGGGENFNRMINADQTDGQGVELDFETLITDNLRVSIGASYNDTELDDSDLAVQACGGGCTVRDPVVVPPGGPPLFPPAIVNIDGNRLPQSPEWVFSMMTHFSKPVGNGEFFIFSDIAYRSEVNFFLYDSVEFEGESLIETGMRIGYAWNDGKQDIAVFGRNLTDEIEAVGGIDFNNLTGFVNEPRRFGVSFSTRF
jgi:iron complex outermembrane receptor protein